MAQISVLTGDLVNSTGVQDPVAFRGRLQALLAEIEDKYAAQAALYRGDGFQIAMLQSANPFEVALLLRSGLIGSSPHKQQRWDARVAIAFGEGELSDSSQNSIAYVQSGRTLDEMSDQRLRVQGSTELADLAFHVASSLLDDLCQQWTPTEAEVLYYHLRNRANHAVIARQLGKKRPTITQALRRARYTLVDTYIKDMNRIAELARA